MAGNFSTCMKKNKTVIGWIIAVTGLAFMAIGIWRGEVAEVCLKAVKICLECIGIG